MMAGVPVSARLHDEEGDFVDVVQVTIQLTLRSAKREVVLSGADLIR